MSISILVDMNLSVEWISHLEQAGWRTGSLVVSGRPAGEMPP